MTYTGPGQVQRTRADWSSQPTGSTPEYGRQVVVAGVALATLRPLPIAAHSLTRHPHRVLLGISVDTEREQR